MKYQYPFKGKYKVTCTFGKKGSWKSGWHIGVDLVGLDSTYVYPISTGVVQSINSKGSSYGNHVVIKHEDDMVSLYAHLDNIEVKLGQTVNLNTKLGIMGDTGNATGAHLHLELHKSSYKYPSNYKQEQCFWIVDPLDWIENHFEDDDKINILDLSVINNGKSAVVSSINVNGTNYIKLRDLEKLFNVNVDFINETPIITSTEKFKSYEYPYKQTKGKKVIKTHNIKVWEVEPSVLRGIIVNDNLNLVKKPHSLNAGYGWWYDKAKQQPYGLSILVSEGNVLCNRVPHNLKCGTLIVHNDNSVEVKQVYDITKEVDVRFAVGGMTICPNVLNVEEGFVGSYSDVIRDCKRVVLGWNEDKHKVIIAGYSRMSAFRGRDLLLELGCSCGITLDAGGSAMMKEGGEFVLKSDGRTQFAALWLDI